MGRQGIEHRARVLKTLKRLARGGEASRLRGEVSFKFDLQPRPSGSRSKAIRMAQTFAAPNYGAHALLKDDTEVWPTHAHGDPDRPIILGAIHHGGEPNVVTARELRWRRYSFVNGSNNSSKSCALSAASLATPESSKSARPALRACMSRILSSTVPLASSL